MAQSNDKPFPEVLVEAIKFRYGGVQIAPQVPGMEMVKEMISFLTLASKVRMRPSEAQYVYDSLLPIAKELKTNSWYTMQAEGFSNLLQAIKDKVTTS